MGYKDKRDDRLWHKLYMRAKRRILDTKEADSGKPSKEIEELVEIEPEVLKLTKQEKYLLFGTRNDENASGWREL